MRLSCAAGFAALFLLAIGSAANAQDVTLTSQDGDVEIAGTLLGFDGEFYRLQTIYGGMDTDEREQVKAAFQAHPDQSPVRILLATDAASEGIDLQNHCHLMVHAEIPWNPNRLEQRNGRIDRYGQEFQPEIIYLLTVPGDEKLAGESEVRSGDQRNPIAGKRRRDHRDAD